MSGEGATLILTIYSQDLEREMRLEVSRQMEQLNKEMEEQLIFQLQVMRGKTQLDYPVETAWFKLVSHV